MKINRITIHNYRSIKDASFHLNDYSLLVGENNTGKTAILTALRMFYEQGGAKFQEGRDFPKFPTDDKESWVEIEFKTTKEEQETLKKEYKSPDCLLRVRRYFHSPGTDLVKPGQSNIYGYESGKLSDNLFYGAKNVSQQKLGQVIYIPEISKTDDAMKLSGPSPFRDTINFIVTKIIKKSPSFQKLNTAFEAFNSEFPKEESPDGYSIKSFQKDVNKHLEEWDINFGLKINSVSSTDLVKNLLSHYIEDTNLNNKEVDLGSFGQGFQRHLIYTLIRLAALYVELKEDKKKDFSPDFTLLLFEEPEAFLHPSQQEKLNSSLISLSSEPEQQVLATTHSPVFVGKNVRDFESIIRLNKTSGVSLVYQLPEAEFTQLLGDNLSLFRRFSEILCDPLADDSLKQVILDQKLGEQDPDEEAKLEEEALKYFMWLDSERACCFFARHIVICEGQSEKTFLEYMIDNCWHELQDRQLYFLNAMGKFNIHRYMNLFGELGVEHSVLMDSDANQGVHEVINDVIANNKNSFSRGIHFFPLNFEAFLGIQAPKRSDLKPINVLLNYNNGTISAETLQNLKDILLKLLQPQD